MKNASRLRSVLALSLLVIFTVVGIGAAFQTTALRLQPNQNATTFKATIVKIDLTTKTVTLKDETGKTYSLVVDPKYGIDLTKYHVGDTVTATIVTTNTTDAVTRARISKQQLIKLQ